MCLVTIPLKNQLTLTEIPIHECGPDCLCWILIEMAGGQPLPKGFPFDLESRAENVTQPSKDHPQPVLPSPLVVLDATEILIVKGICKGRSDRQIGIDTGIKRARVTMLIRYMCAKLHIQTRNDLAKYYVAHRLTVSSV